ncbi:winged helix-turn-helix transcriptional regulator [Nocardioides sp. NPDC051685]|uniref:winged helix-turn-helix transcriptional regulator n=1 Tax=Nocardioides sp. NPDC051685 TaxID=3364334 RepID=UPI0037B40A3C
MPGLLGEAGDISSSALTARLKELGEAGLVTHDGGYDLTDHGSSLLDLMAPLDAWAKEWSTTH